MKTCKNCEHQIRKIKGIWKHRNEHYKYSGIGGSGGVTFNDFCMKKGGDVDFKTCGCRKPEPK